VSKLALPAGTTVWEPHAGAGSIVRALLGAGCGVHFSDLDSEAPVYRAWESIPPQFRRGSGHVACDALDGWPWHLREKPDWIVGNPPFGDAEAHVRAALDVARIGVAFLLRDAFAEGRERADFWASNPADRWTFDRRPRFLQRWPDGRVGPMLATDEEGRPIEAKRPTHERPWKLVGWSDSCAYALFVWRRGLTWSEARWGRLEVSDG
jgi:hypothetical protein